MADSSASAGDRARWETVNALSRRGESVVLQVREKGNAAGPRYALKELKGGYGNTKLRRFAREIDVTRTLAERHSGIVPVVDYWVPSDGAKGAPWYVMPLAERSLERQTEYAGQPLQVLDLAISLADTLTAAHEAKIVHRDLKPGNLLVMPDGRVYLADFGICYLFDPTARITGEAAATLGTADFVAPELLGGGPVENVGVRADIYSLGKTMYALLAGGEVFPRERHRDAAWSLDGRLGSQAASHIHGLLDRMVTERPEDRFTDMGEAKRHFERAKMAIQLKADFSAGLYGAADTALSIYRHLALILATPSHPERRAILSGAIDRAVNLATAHIDATGSPDPFHARTMRGTDSKVVVEAGEILLGVGAALIRAADDAKAAEWLARLIGLTEIDVHGSTRTEIILCDAAGYAFTAAGGIAWRQEAFQMLDAISAAYLQTLSRTLYPVTQNSTANDWLVTVHAESEVLQEAEPWVSQNAGTSIGIVAGVAMLRVIASFTGEQLDAFSQNPNEFLRYPFGDTHAFREKCWGWFGAFAQKCSTSRATVEALQGFIFSPGKAGLRGTCAKLTPALGRALHNLFLTRMMRDVHLQWVPGGNLWFRWVNDLLKSNDA